MDLSKQFGDNYAHVLIVFNYNHFIKVRVLIVVETYIEYSFIHSCKIIAELECSLGPTRMGSLVDE